MKTVEEIEACEKVMDGQVLEKNDSILLDIEYLARTLSCSSRHLRRLADSGRMPLPVRIGRLVRWRKADIDGWISAGCPKVGKPFSGQSRRQESP